MRKDPTLTGGDRRELCSGEAGVRASAKRLMGDAQAIDADPLHE